MPGPVSIMGVNVIPFESYEQAVACVAERIKQRKYRFVF